MHSLLFNGAFGAYILLKSWHFSAGPIHPLVDSYLADLLAMPVILTFTETAMVKLRGDRGRLSIGMVLFAVVYASVVMEVLLPHLKSSAVGDPLDAVMYAIGALAWWQWGRDA
jgi:hypothetical protein